MEADVRSILIKLYSVSYVLFERKFFCSMRDMYDDEKPYYKYITHGFQ